MKSSGLLDWPHQIPSFLLLFTYLLSEYGENGQDWPGIPQFPHPLPEEKKRRATSKKRPSWFAVFSTPWGIQPDSTLMFTLHRDPQRPLIVQGRRSWKNSALGVAWSRETVRLKCTHVLYLWIPMSCMLYDADSSKKNIRSVLENMSEAIVAIGNWVWWAISRFSSPCKTWIDLADHAHHLLHQ